MTKPCHFCGNESNDLVYPNEKTRQWFLYPYEQYPLCQNCKKIHSEGNVDALITLLHMKWNKLGLHEQDIKEVQNDQRT